MTEVEVNCNLQTAVNLLERTFGPRLYWIHNRVGTREWEVKIVCGKTVVKVSDPKMLTYLLLKLK